MRWKLLIGWCGRDEELIVGVFIGSDNGLFGLIGSDYSDFKILGAYPKSDPIRIVHVPIRSESDPNQFGSDSDKSEKSERISE